MKVTILHEVEKPLSVVSDIEILGLEHGQVVNPGIFVSPFCK